MTATGIGARVLRTEDKRFLTGTGRYVDDLHLNTLTDYHSPGPFGAFANAIYWTNLVIKCTNLMHWVLSQLHRIIPNYGLCIICLTILVRGLMFPISRKQAMTTMRMLQWKWRKRKSSRRRQPMHSRSTSPPCAPR